MTPPEPENPPIDKKVNDKEHADLDERYEVFTYTVTTKVPLDATAFTITDTLVDELEFTNTDETKVTIDGAALTAEELEAQVTREEQTLTVKLTEAQVKADGDKEVVLTFQAKIRENAKLDTYESDGKISIPNTATYESLGDLYGSANSNTVTVTPPTEEETEKPGKPEKPEKPEKPGTPAKTVKTGDDTPVGLWTAVLVIALAAVAGVVLFRRKKRK